MNNNKSVHQPLFIFAVSYILSLVTRGILFSGRIENMVLYYLCAVVSAVLAVFALSTLQRYMCSQTKTLWKWLPMFLFGFAVAVGLMCLYIFNGFDKLVGLMILFYSVCELIGCVCGAIGNRISKKLQNKE